MNKRLITCLVIIVGAAVAGYMIYTYFEIYPRKIPTAPLREVRINNFAALERWLLNTGRHFRVEKRGSPQQIAAAAEKTVLAYASFCTWENAGAILLPWIDSGGNLLICLDDRYDTDDDVSVFLSALGIIISDPYSAESTEKSTEESAEELIEKLNGELNETAEEIDEHEETAETLEAQGESREESTEAEAITETPVPQFDRDICFLFAEDAPTETLYAITDRRGLVRLVQITIGDGTLTVTGKPLFMYNSRLEREINASLAWSLTGAFIHANDVDGADGVDGVNNDENSGMLFIRDRSMPKGLFGKIAERGNFTPLILSALLLIIAGFWMVIPLCGPVYSEKKSTARPLRQRFLAETRFLKKHNALESYLHVYLQWLKPKLIDAPIDEPNVREIHYIEQALASEAHTGRHRVKPLKYRDIIKALRKIQAYTERL